MDGVHKRPTEFIEWDELIRLGHVGTCNKKWDDGLYVTGLVGGLQINFLVDTGSTATILSKTLFDSLDPQQELSLRRDDRTLVDVNNHEITIYGLVEVPVKFDSLQFSISCVVCDILNEGILGQDFLMKYVQRLDLKKMTLCTSKGDIQCWLGGEACMVCRVTVKETVTIQPETASIVPITVPQRAFIRVWSCRNT